MVEEGEMLERLSTLGSDGASTSIASVTTVGDVRLAISRRIRWQAVRQQWWKAQDDHLRDEA